MELRDYLRVLRAHWVGVLLLTLLTLVVATGYTLHEPKVYAANASGFVSTGASANPALGSVNDQLAKSRATSYVDIATSRATAQEVIKNLGLRANPETLVNQISVQQPTNTVILEITARASTPRTAQTLANAWVKALAEQVKSIEAPNGKLKDGTPRVIPVESAQLPTSPVSPRPTVNLGLALILGLLLGLGYAVTRSTLDRRLRSAEGIMQRFPVSVAGSIPFAKVLGHKPGTRAHIAVEADGSSPGHPEAAEAFRKLRTNLIYMDVDNPPRVIVVTSPRPSDGKSTIAANLAAAIAVGGEQVLLVDADLRRPTVGASFGLIEGVGLTDVLVGRISVEEAIQQVSQYPNLDILAAGGIPPNPSELLGSHLMGSVLRKLAQERIVVLDAPPLLPVTDAALLTAVADGALVVVSAGKTLDTELGGSLDSLERVNARCLGVILNRVPRRGPDSDYYAGYYYYNTPSQPGSPPSSSAPRRKSRHSKRSALPVASLLGGTVS